MSAEATIDLGAVVANWRRTGRDAAAVVKADGYGLGAVPVATALARAGCRRFFVAHLGEGVALRAALPDVEIAVLNGVGAAAAIQPPTLEATLTTFRRHRLTPALNSASDVVLAADLQLPAILHIDTGMARLGIPWAEASALLADPVLTRTPLTAVISHLACADEPDHPLNATQLDRFRAVAAALPGVPASLAASSGSFLGPAYAFDFVRPGAALYGIAPLNHRPNPLTQAVSLHAPVIGVATIPVGTPVGYGATWIATRPTTVATLALGYADGYLRSGSNRGEVWFEGRPAPIIGRVSMDLTTVDVTDHPTPPGVGASAEVIGPNRPLDHAAAELGTIGYELLTRLGPRIVRRYVD